MMKPLPLLAALCLLAVGCAQENTPSTGEKARDFLSLYMQRYHPGIQANQDGLFILEDTPGTGKSWSTDSAYCYTLARTTIRTLGGTISSTTEEKLAQQLGTYSAGNYYGPKYQRLGEGASYAGLDALFKGMRAGGTRKAIIPSWLLTTSRFDTEQKYINDCSNTTHLEYTVTFLDQVHDINATEKDSLYRYVRRHYGEGVNSSSFPNHAAAGDFYFISDSTKLVGTAQFPADTTIQLNYTGRLLNGQVFDTTVEKAAKDAGIYDASKSYTPVMITYASNYSEVQMENSSSLISGFSGGLCKLRWEGQKAVVLFISDLGYTSSGSGQSIPPFSPLIFELEVVKN